MLSAVCAAACLTGPTRSGDPTLPAVQTIGVSGHSSKLMSWHGSHATLAEHSKPAWEACDAQHDTTVPSQCKHMQEVQSMGPLHQKQQSHIGCAHQPMSKLAFAISATGVDLQRFQPMPTAHAEILLSWTKVPPADWHSRASPCGKPVACLLKGTRPTHRPTEQTKPGEGKPVERRLTSQCSMQVAAAAEEAAPQPPHPKRVRRGQQAKLQQAPAAQPDEPSRVPGTAAAVQLVVQLVTLAGDAVQLLGPTGAGSAVQCAEQLAVPVVQQLQSAAAEVAASDEGVSSGAHLYALKQQAFPNQHDLLQGAHGAQ